MNPLALHHGVNCPNCPKALHAVAPRPHVRHQLYLSVPSHHMTLPLCITCTNVSHVAPRHHMPLHCKFTAANATAPIKAMHQVPLPKEVHIIVPRYYISLPRAKGQAITCHCPATSAAIDPWQKSNSPNFRHYMPLPQVIGCDCPKTLHADASPIVVPGQGITCHCLTAYAPIAPMQYLSWPQGTVLHRRETKKREPSILKWSESVKRLVNHWY